MKRAWLAPLPLAFLASAWLLTAPTTGSSAVPGEELVTKETKGLRFKVPADWPVEERGGSIAPIPVEEYLSKKFSAVSARFDAAEKRVTALETKLSDLDRRLGVVDQRLGVLDQRVGTVEQRVTTAERTQGEQGRALQAVQEQRKPVERPAGAAPSAPGGAVLEDLGGDLVPREETGR